MTAVTHPSKEAVRAFMQQHLVERKPLPTPAEVRRQLGWQLVDANKTVECAR